MPRVADVVALLADEPTLGLAKGQVGTVVESLDADTVEVEFADAEGRTFALGPVPVARLLVLRYEPTRLSVLRSHRAT